MGRPSVNRVAMELFMEMKYEKHTHEFVISAKKEGANALNAHCHLKLDSDKYESNIKARVMSNLIDTRAEAKIKETTYVVSFNAAMEKTALKVQTIITAPK